MREVGSPGAMVAIAAPSFRRPPPAPVIMRTAKLALAALLLGISAAPAAAQNVYTWTGTEATLSPRLFRNGVSSVAGTPKPFPGTFAEFVSYTTFSFVNTSASTQVFTAGLLAEVGGSAPSFSLYLGSFDPLNLATGYLGDSGSSCIGVPCSASTAFGVDVSGGATVVLVAISANNGPAEAGQSFTWTGPSDVFSPVTNVPEPSSAALVLVGLAGLAVRKRRAA